MHNYHTECFALLCSNYSAYLMGTTVINIIAHVGGEGLAWIQVCAHAYRVDLMLASSVQAVVVCNATAPRVCTLVLFI